LKIAEDGRWHVHLHVLVETPWLDQKQLSQEWLAVTGDSSYVFIKAIQNPEREARYIAKYCAKGTDSSTYRSPEHLAEYILAIKGRRLITTFGSWRGMKLEDAAPDTPTDWRSLGSLGRFLTAAGQGDAYAITVLASLYARKELDISLAFGSG
jgi:hypothetical protein